MRSAMSRLILVVLATLLTSAAAAGQQRKAALVLQVLAHETGEPLGGAQVRIPARNMAQSSNDAGVAHIRGIPAGSHMVEITRVGYQTEKLVMEFSPGQVVEGEIEMMVEPLALDSLQVTAVQRSPRLSRNGFYDREQMGFGTFLSREQIQARRYVRGTQVVQGVERTRLRPTNTASGYAILQKRFGGDCHVLVWIDGGQATAEDLGNLMSDQIEAMEVYHGEHLPMQFNQIGRRGFSHCGAVVVWTRR